MRVPHDSEERALAAAFVEVLAGLLVGVVMQGAKLMANDENDIATRAVAMRERVTERQNMIKANSSIGAVFGMEMLEEARGMAVCGFCNFGDMVISIDNFMVQNNSVE